MSTNVREFLVLKKLDGFIFLVTKAKSSHEGDIA